MDAQDNINTGRWYSQQLDDSAEGKTDEMCLHK